MRDYQSFLLFILNLPPLLVLLIWPIMAPMSFMAFDTPGSEKNPFAWLLVLTMISYPLPTLYGATRTYKNARSKTFAWCLGSTLITYSGLLTIIGTMALGAIVDRLLR